jgi:hypothetical protein
MRRCSARRDAGAIHTEEERQDLERRSQCAQGLRCLWLPARRSPSPESPSLAPESEEPSVPRDISLRVLAEEEAVSVRVKPDMPPGPHEMVTSPLTVQPPLLAWDSPASLSPEGPVLAPFPTARGCPRTSTRCQAVVHEVAGAQEARAPEGGGAAAQARVREATRTGTQARKRAGAEGGGSAGLKQGERGHQD